MPMPAFKLHVLCLTYNHGSYITETMDGFCMQKTKFPFVCSIIDDASTDGEQDAIIKYLNDNFDFKDSCSYIDETDSGRILFARHKHNKSCYFAVVLLSNNLYNNPEGLNIKLDYIKQWREGCKYEAICEGDDYWIDSNKLQMQVDFLEGNDDFSICSHRIRKYDQDTNEYYVDRLQRMFNNRTGCEFDNRTKVWISETSSIVYRRAAEVEYINYPYEQRDNTHMYFLLKYGKGFCLSNIMSVYRQHQGGIFSKQDIDAQLIQGSYKALKNLYAYEKTKDARYLYYRCYALTFLSTHGRILTKERFEFRKIIALPFYIFSIITGVHPVYKREE